MLFLFFFLRFSVIISLEQNGLARVDLHVSQATMVGLKVSTAGPYSHQELPSHYFLALLSCSDGQKVDAEDDFILQISKLFKEQFSAEPWLLLILELLLDHLTLLLSS